MHKTLKVSNFNGLLLDVVTYLDLWNEVVEKGLLTEDEEDINDIKTNELRNYLEVKGVKFSSEVDSKSDDMSYWYYADFYIPDENIVTEYFEEEKDRNKRVMSICFSEDLFYQDTGDDENGYWVKYYTMKKS